MRDQEYVCRVFVRAPTRRSFREIEQLWAAAEEYPDQPGPTRAEASRKARELNEILPLELYAHPVKADTERWPENGRWCP